MAVEEVEATEQSEEGEAVEAVQAPLLGLACRELESVGHRRTAGEDGLFAKEDSVRPAIVQQPNRVALP